MFLDCGPVPTKRYFKSFVNMLMNKNVLGL